MMIIEIYLINANYLSGDFVDELSRHHSGQALRTYIVV